MTSIVRTTHVQEEMRKKECSDSSSGSVHRNSFIIKYSFTISFQNCKRKYTVTRFRPNEYSFDILNSHVISLGAIESIYFSNPYFLSAEQRADSTGPVDGEPQQGLAAHHARGRKARQRTRALERSYIERSQCAIQVHQPQPRRCNSRGSRQSGQK